MALRIIADTNVCQGTASCLMAAPELCDIDETTWKVTVLVDELSEEQREAAEDAVRACPTRALRLQED